MRDSERSKVTCSGWPMSALDSLASIATTKPLQLLWSKAGIAFWATFQEAKASMSMSLRRVSSSQCLPSAAPAVSSRWQSSGSVRWAAKFNSTPLSTRAF